MNYEEREKKFAEIAEVEDRVERYKQLREFAGIIWEQMSVRDREEWYDHIERICLDRVDPNADIDLVEDYQLTQDEMESLHYDMQTDPDKADWTRWQEWYNKVIGVC